MSSLISDDVKKIRLDSIDKKISIIVSQLNIKIKELSNINMKLKNTEEVIKNGDNINKTHKMWYYDDCKSRVDISKHKDLDINKYYDVTCYSRRNYKNNKCTTTNTYEIVYPKEINEEILNLELKLSDLQKARELYL